MYGTVAHLQAREGQEQAVLDYGRRWLAARGRETGLLASTLFQLDSDPRAFIMVAVFPDEASYRRNANDPETDRWYRGMRELLDADPAWHDGQVVEQRPSAGI